MWSRIFKKMALWAIFGPIVVCGCGDAPTALRVDLCPRGDRMDLKQQLAGGSLAVSVLDGAHGQLSQFSTAADRGTRVDFSLPGAAAQVHVEARQAATVVASGDGAIRNGQVCVCLALAAQVPAACQGVTCELSQGQCLFFDAQSGGPVGARTIQVGDNDGDTIQQATSDTFLSNESGNDQQNFGHADYMSAGNVEVALVRFDLHALPRSAIIDDATLSLQLASRGGATSADGPLGIYVVREPWQEEIANWHVRSADPNQAGSFLPWAAPGCGPGSRDASPLTTFPQSLQNDRSLLNASIRSAVATWAGDPTTNFGLALLLPSMDDVDLATREVFLGAALRPRLSVTFRLE